MNRRTFLKAAALALTTTTLYSWRVEPHLLEITHIPLPVPNLPPSLHGKTIAHLTDIHVGRSVSDAYLIDTFKRVAAESPDFVVATGDYISYHESVIKQARSVYAHFPRGKITTLGTLGNHDYGPAWRREDVAQEVVTLLEASGIHVLRNQVVEIQGLQILGFDDVWAKRFDGKKTLANANLNRPALALSHNPDTADHPIWEGFHGWILSGHTHGGQCKPPFLPPPILPVRNQRYTAGTFSLSGDRSLYINRGVGHLLPFRFNVRPEVAIFHLVET